MTAKLLCVILGVTFAVSQPSNAAAQCVTCGGDYSRCNGYPSSGNGIHCTSACECTLVEVSYLDTLHPGFFLRDDDGKKVVESVIPNSPAERAGIRPADFVLSINPHGSQSCNQSWASSLTDQKAVVVIKRGNVVREHRVDLLPIRTYLATAGALSSQGKLMRVSFKTEMGLSVVFHALGH
jgi:hypothetical protein